MKKWILLLLASLSMIFAGCTTLKLDVKSVKTSEAKLVKIEEVIPTINSIIVTISNNSDEVVEVVWDRSKINGASPFLKGKYIDAGKSQTNDIIAPKDKSTFTIYSSDDVGYAGGWYIDYLDYPAKLILCIKKGNSEEFIISEIDAKLVEEK